MTTKPIVGSSYKLKATLSITQVTHEGKVVEIKKSHPLVFHSDSTHDPGLSVTFRSLVPLGRSFPASLRSASGQIFPGPLVSCCDKHFAFKQSNEFVFLVPCRTYLSLAFFTFPTQGYLLESVKTVVK